jgi:hypothetical protein
MRVDLALLADYAAITNDRKLIVSGVFDAVLIGKVPGKLSRMMLALKLRVYGDEPEEHKVLVRLVEPDGKDVIPATDLGMSVRREDPSLDVVSPLVVSFDNVMFQRVGPYSIDVFLDGAFADRVTFDVVLRSAENKPDQPLEDE